jgi:PEP-CTERM motif
MRKRLACLSVGLLFVLGVSPQEVAADPITVNFDGTVTISGGPLEEIFGVPIGVGDSFSGFFSYDPNTPDGNRLPDFGFYQGTGQSLGVDLGTGLTVPIETFQTFDNGLCFEFQDCDAFVVVAHPMIPGFEFFQVLASFKAPAASRQGDALPRDLAEFTALYTTGEFRLGAFRSSGGFDPPFTHTLVGTLSLQPEAVVPEPGTLLLVGTGAFGVLGRALRQRRTSGK